MATQKLGKSEEEEEEDLMIYSCLIKSAQVKVSWIQCIHTPFNLQGWSFVLFMLNFYSILRHAGAGAMLTQ